MRLPWEWYSGRNLRWGAREPRCPQNHDFVVVKPLVLVRKDITSKGRYDQPLAYCVPGHGCHTTASGLSLQPMSSEP